jgi:hypothetical protein
MTLLQIRNELNAVVTHAKRELNQECGQPNALQPTIENGLDDDIPHQRMLALLGITIIRKRIAFHEESTEEQIHSDIGLCRAIAGGMGGMKNNRYLRQLLIARCYTYPVIYKAQYVLINAIHRPTAKDSKLSPESQAVSHRLLRLKQIRDICSMK